MTNAPDMNVDELLAAYADDPASLPVAERAAVEARLAADPAAAREVEELRAVLGDVRAHGDVADRGTDWAALEAGIRAAVPFDRLRVTGLRTRRWRWAAGMGVALAAAAGLALWWQHRRADEGGFVFASMVPAVPAPALDPVPTPAPDAMDHEEALDEVALELDEGDDFGGDELHLDDEREELIGRAVERVPVADLEAEDGLFPGLDTGWLDDLSETEVEQALRWLDQQGAG